MEKSRKRILVIGTGGTIACKQTENGLKPVLSSEELIRYVPEAREFCEVESVQAFNIDSTNIQAGHWVKIAELVEKNYENYDGFVVCHGTDTMAYTAAALSYLIQNSPKPVTITGAQKPMGVETTDAKTNLLDSLRFTADDRAAGVNVVFAGKVIAGARARKVQSKSYNAFESINFPYIAIVQEDRVLFYLNNKEETAEGVTFFRSLNPKVGVLKLIPSMDVSVLDCMAKLHDGIIVESFGVGGLPNEGDASFQRAIQKWMEKGKIFIVATQVANEGSNMSIYEVGKKAKQQLGLLETYDMTLEAAVAKLMWILEITKDQEEIRKLFYQTINYDTLWMAGKRG